MNNITYKKYVHHYDIGQRFNNLEVVAYVHMNGTYHPFPELLGGDKQNEHSMRYVVYCHKCGTKKTMSGKNLEDAKSCGCISKGYGKNFNWEGKSTKI